VVCACECAGLDTKKHIPAQLVNWWCEHEELNQGIPMNVIVEARECAGLDTKYTSMLSL